MRQERWLRRVTLLLLFASLYFLSERVVLIGLGVTVMLTAWQVDTFAQQIVPWLGRGLTLLVAGGMTFLSFRYLEVERRVAFPPEKSD